MEEIPFSGRTGHLYAKKLVDLYIALLQNEFSIEPQQAFKAAEPFYVCEFGAGMALLSKHFLDVLKEDYPEVYVNTRLIITDSSAEMMENLQKISVFYNHFDQIEFQALDSTDFEGWPDKKPVLAYSSYLLSCFSCRHIEYKQGKINELLVKTSVPENAILLDTTSFPYQVMDAQQIKKCILSNDRDKLKVLGARIKHLLKEEIITLDLNESDLSANEKQELTGLLGSDEIKNDVCFNYNPGIKAHIEKALNSLHEKGIYIASDFGSVEFYHPDPDKLTKSYGNSLFRSVSFAYIKSFCGHNKITSFCSSRPNDYVQECVFSNSSQISQTLKKSMSGFISSEPTEKLQSVLRSLVDINPSDNYLTDFEQAVSSLSGEEQKDYFFLKSCASLLLSQGLNKQAYEYALKLLNTYAEFAIDGYSILGMICQAQNFFDEALECYATIINICGHDWATHEALASVNYKLNNYQKAVEHLEKAIYYARTNNIWPLVYMLNAIHEKLGQPDKADQIAANVFDLAKKQKGLIPEEILEEFQKKQ
ncbi:SAM-dependent methyltransferase [Candidatus Margulisiibacteriota bacterium]